MTLLRKHSSFAYSPQLEQINKTLVHSNIAPSELRQFAGRYEAIYFTIDVGTVEHGRAVSQISRPSISPHNYRYVYPYNADHRLRFPFMKAGLVSNLRLLNGSNSNSFLLVVNSRRWLQCAVAIKHFKLRYDRFPESLDELIQVQLPKQITLDYSDKPFRYRVADDAAKIWNHAAEPPKDEYGSVGPIFTQVAEIR